MLKTSLMCRIFAGFQILGLVFAVCPNRLAAQPKSAQTVFSNSAPITINTASGLTQPTIAAPYPSSIAVSGMTGTITKVEVTLTGVTHSLTEIDFLLVSPTGAKFIFLSDSTGPTVDDQVYKFSDSGTVMLSGSNSVSGIYRPTDVNTGTDTFPAPAPTGPYNVPATATFASVFNGADPNGTWNLYAVDDTLTNAGSLNSGWSLHITTDGAPQTFSNSNYIALNDTVALAAPFGSTINVSGQSGVITNLKVSLTGFTHTRPNDLDILLVSPNGKGALLMSDVPITQAANGINLTFDSAAVNILNNSPMVSGSYRPTDFSGVGDFFPTPAPLRPHLNTTAALDSYNGFSPNGEWRLFVTDGLQNNSGSITGGWSLDITTAPFSPPTPPSCSAPTFFRSNFSTGINPTNLAIADFNNDNKADLAVSNQVSNDVSILPGNGDGTFGAQTLVPAGSGPYSIVAGKFNGDNNVDLAVANSGSNNVSILLGNGNGTFSAPTNFLTGSSPISIAAGDFNNDSKIDLVVANFGGFFSGTVSILLGNGAGGFSSGTSLRTRTQPAFVAVANLNADANPDLVVVNFGADSVSTFFGNGNGTFQLIQNITTIYGPASVEVADLNGDGFLDMAIPNYNFDTVTTCTGNSSGIFGSCSTGTTGANPISITAADFLGSGTKSIATALSGSNRVKVLTSDVDVGENPNAVESADLNGDGKPDMVTANSGSNDVSILINNCLAAKGNIFDFSGNRRTDYAVFRPGSAVYYVQPINPNGIARVFGRSEDKIVPADYDGDRRTDFAFYRPENGLWFVIDQFSRPIYFTQFGVAEDIPVPADFDGDGKSDIAVWRPSDGTWYVRRSSDNSVQINQFGMNGDKPVAADFDGDDKADFGIYRPSTGVWYIWKSSDGQFVITQFGITEDKTVVGDYDGDGKADIAVWRPSTGVWYVLKSTDGGFFAVSFGLTGDIPLVGDFEGDGRYDYAVFRPSEGNWYVQKSSDNGSSVFQWGIAGDIPLPSAFVR